MYFDILLKIKTHISNSLMIMKKTALNAISCNKHIVLLKILKRAGLNKDGARRNREEGGKISFKETVQGSRCSVIFTLSLENQATSVYLLCVYYGRPCLL